MANVEWKDTAFKMRLAAIAVRNAGRAAAYAAGQSRRLMKKGGGKSHDAHSPPGHPPFVQTGRLRGSVTSQVVREGNTVIGRYGSNVEYARRLEKGFFGATANGVQVRQAPRPYLRPVLRIFKKELLAILFGKK